ncbi:MAG: amidohydrolase family protein [Pseudomonadota bacterium]
MRRLAILLITGLTVACDSPISQFEPDDQFILETTVIDVVNKSTQTDMAVVVRGNQIFAVLPMAEIRVPREANTVHRGGFVMPGLWDMHVHSLSDATAAVERRLPLYVAHGVTGIRDMGSIVSGVIETRDRLDADPTLIAPEIIAAGPLLDGVKLQWYGDLPLVLTDPVEVDAALSNLLDQGLDFFKVYDQLSTEVYDAILKYAAQREISVAGHPPWRVGITKAAQSGQKTFEHLSIFTFGDCVEEPREWFNRALNAKFGSDGYSGYYDVVLEFFALGQRENCNAAIQSLAANRSFVTPTLVMEMNDRSRVHSDDLVWLDATARPWCESTLQSIDKVEPSHREAAIGAFAAFANRLHQAGVRLLAGSDNPNYCLVAGASLHWELERLVEVGLNPMEALATATINPALLFGREASEGQVTHGFRANLLVLQANPVDDIRNTRRIAGVFIDGRWVGKAAIDQIKADSLPKAAASAE